MPAVINPSQHASLPMTNSSPDDLTGSYRSDSQLGYAAARRVFPPGEGLRFDAAYRLAHLPLVAPNHPAVIPSMPGKDYRNGRYERARYALVAPVPAAALAASDCFRAADDALRSATFAGKIAWDVCARRADRLHATLVSQLYPPDADRVIEPVADALRALGPITFRLSGPFVGDRNLGRIYFPVYPQQIDGDDAFGRLQEAAGAPRTRFYAVGYYNLTDELDPHEAAELAVLLGRWGPETMAEIPLSHIELHATNDDLVLSSHPVVDIAAVTGRVTRHRDTP